MMWSRIKKYLASLMRLTPHHAYAMIFAVIGIGTLGTQVGLISIPLIKGPPPQYAGPAPSPSLEYRPYTAAGLKTRFEKLGYILDRVRLGEMDVPRLYVTELPQDLAQLTSISARKELFFLMVLPLALRVNERLDEDRSHLLKIRRQLNMSEPLAEEEAQWLAELAGIYAVEPADIRTLLARVDRIPISLILAQAANESGWGTSRFAVDGNALFGQWTENWNVPGLRPAGRDEDEAHRVRAFLKPMRSVWKYALNLNTHPAYREFRLARAAARQENQSLSGSALAATLSSYSERGKAYTEELRTIIRANRLESLNDAKLAGPPPTS